MLADEVLGERAAEREGKRDPLGRQRRDRAEGRQDPGACAFSINGRAGRALGSPGAPVTVRITKDNFRDFLSS